MSESLFKDAPAEKIGSVNRISIGQTLPALTHEPKRNQFSQTLTLSASWLNDNTVPIQQTDDTSGFYWRLTFGSGGSDAEAEIDPIVGLFMTVPTVKWSLYGVYGPPTPTPINLAPTTPPLIMYASIAEGTRPASASAPTRTRRFAIPVAGGSSQVLPIPAFSTGMVVLGVQAPYNVTFYTSLAGQPSQFIILPVGGTILSAINIPAGAVAFSVSAPNPEAVVMAVFQLGL